MNINALNLRQAIMYKMQGSSPTSVQETINDAISSRMEKTLPGLGVLFEVLWQNSNSDLQQQMVTTISEHIPTNTDSPV
ncbi:MULTISPECIES: small acid-soluble spore protein SspI [Brevibacillus]|uniref:Small, acid-soluble spore protein I n=1 Tax=Brevibacillus laterosporus TaxID=1465 RepID=A0AAP8U6T2_BRELA|nr:MULTISPECIES: small acid-soluble spore protein SspI [Brevibacillus]ATO50432.1 small acid-soluble spore protein SspI [Brevibacillus laterosporus DSM 25]AYB39378.1 small acid-soluble spore protein SspI [Brevibacillus laterosporus]MBG9773415.1 spore protein [Brevibacillus laterosporus]MBG9790655.1 spore protein [Brevibacillus laterosporus]MBG9796379.1 spore protein [Brevibacillus laterosporus]